MRSQTALRLDVGRLPVRQGEGARGVHRHAGNRILHDAVVDALPKGGERALIHPQLLRLLVLLVALGLIRIMSALSHSASAAGTLTKVRLYCAGLVHSRLRKSCESG